jgi:hypothetical protein
MLKNDTGSQNNMASTLSLNNYPSISLSKMEDVALLNRTDTKYVLPVATLKQIMPQLSNAYSALVVNKQRCSRYQTLYFDTSEFALYHQHHAGILDRYKVRSREYVDSQLTFLEVKHKTNKGRTIKSRVQTPELATSLVSETSEFLHRAYPYNAAELEPKLWVEYTRITLVSHHRKERATIDLDLSYTWNGQTISQPHLAIVEIKQEGFSHRSDIERQLRRHQVRPTGFSKYCVGISLLYPDLKHNNFKSKLRIVEKLARGQSHVYIH